MTDYNKMVGESATNEARWKAFSEQNAELRQELTEAYEKMPTRVTEAVTAAVAKLQKEHDDEVAALKAERDNLKQHCKNVQPILVRFGIYNFDFQSDANTWKEFSRETRLALDDIGMDVEAAKKICLDRMMRLVQSKKGRIGATTNQERAAESLLKSKGIPVPNRNDAVNALSARAPEGIVFDDKNTETELHTRQPEISIPTNVDPAGKKPRIAKRAAESASSSKGDE
jgi:hypothetical protein